MKQHGREVSWASKASLRHYSHLYSSGRIGGSCPHLTTMETGKHSLVCAQKDEVGFVCD